MRASKGVIRVDSGRTRAWQVRIDKWFGDVAWGGKKKALAAAKAWRARAQPLLGLPETPDQGIGRHHCGRGWKARITKSFSDSVCGSSLVAAEAAAEWRADAVRILFEDLPVLPPRSGMARSNTGERGITKTTKDGGPAFTICVGGRRSSVSMRKWGRKAMAEARRRRDLLDARRFDLTKVLDQMLLEKGLNPVAIRREARREIQLYEAKRRHSPHI